MKQNKPKFIVVLFIFAFFSVNQVFGNEWIEKKKEKQTFQQKIWSARVWIFGDEPTTDCTRSENCELPECRTGDAIRLNEIQPHPKSMPESIGEYIELLNPTDQCVNMTGWYLAENDGHITPLPQAWLPARTLFTVSYENQQPEYCFFQVDSYFGEDFGMRNVEDEVFLHSPDGLIASYFAYYDDECASGASYEFCGDNGWLCGSTPYITSGNECPNLGSPGKANVCGE